MKRETTNTVRYLMEEWIPPAVRDSRFFRRLMELAWGSHVRHLADFRQRAPFLTEAEYEALYRKHPRVHSGTDNSEACIEKIAADVVGNSVCDVGCGTGYLLERIRAKRPDLQRCVGVDFVFPPDQPSVEGVEFIEAKIETLPFEDGAFDTVICTHVIEHILDYRQALAELRRIARRRLIIVVPREREGKYTFNPHFNFFAYPATLLRALQPIPESYECVEIKRDLYYREDKAALA